MPPGVWRAVRVVRVEGACGERVVERRIRLSEEEEEGEEGRGGGVKDFRVGGCRVRCARGRGVEEERGE